MFKNLKVRTRLIAGFLFIALLGAIVATIGVVNLGALHDEGEAMYERELMGLSHIKDANINLISLGRARSNFLLAETDEERQRQIDLRRKYENLFQENLSQAKPLFVTLRAKELFANVDATWTEYETAMDKTYALAAAEKSQQHSEQVMKAAAEARAYGDRLDASLQELSKQKEARAKAAEEEGSALYETSRAVMIGLALFAMGLSVFLGLVITHSIVRPLDRAVEIAKSVAAGDLTSKIEVASTNEIGHLLQALKDMNESLGRIVGQVRAGTETISTAANQIAAGNMDLSSRTEQQASALEETASSMEELTATVKQNAENAQEANRLAMTASEVAFGGGEAVAGVVTTMTEIEDSAKKISEITSVIDGIAFQTNILALNAAVEAARAGEQGRGFAVVASEVRALARRSADAAKEIKELIAESVQKVDAGVHLVEHAGETMHEVVASIKRVTDLMGDIAAASREQSSGIEQVHVAVSQMDEMTQHNASLVEEAAAAAQSLHEQADQLSRVVGAFHLDSSVVASSAPPRLHLVKTAEARGRQEQTALPGDQRGLRPLSALAH